MAKHLLPLLLLLPLLASPGFAQLLGFLESASETLLGGSQAPGGDASTPDNILETSQVAVGDTPPQPLATTGQGYDGRWELVTENSGVSSMHMVVMHTNKAIMFDATNFGPSNISLANGNCRQFMNRKNQMVDCYAHAVEFDLDTAKIRPLKVVGPALLADPPSEGLRITMTLPLSLSLCEHRDGRGKLRRLCCEGSTAMVDGEHPGRRVLWQQTPALSMQIRPPATISTPRAADVVIPSTPHGHRKEKGESPARSAPLQPSTAPTTSSEEGRKRRGA